MMTPLTGISDREIYNEVVKEQCRCGSPKKRGKSFCAKCYIRLPKELQDRLYQRTGYVMTYREATAELDKEA